MHVHCHTHGRHSTTAFVVLPSREKVSWMFRWRESGLDGWMHTHSPTLVLRRRVVVRSRALLENSSPRERSEMRVSHTARPLSIDLDALELPVVH